MFKAARIKKVFKLQQTLALMRYDIAQMDRIQQPEAVTEKLQTP